MRVLKILKCLKQDSWPQYCPFHSNPIESFMALITMPKRRQNMCQGYGGACRRRDFQFPEESHKYVDYPAVMIGQIRAEASDK